MHPGSIKHLLNYLVSTDRTAVQNVLQYELVGMYLMMQQQWNAAAIKRNVVCIYQRIEKYNRGMDEWNLDESMQVWID